MSPVTFCAEAPQARNLVGLIVGLAPAAALAYGVHYFVSLRRGSRPFATYVRRVCTLFVFLVTVLASMMAVGGPCAISGVRQLRNSGGYVAHNNPTSLSERLVLAVIMSVALALFFPLCIPTREK